MKTVLGVKIDDLAEKEAVQMIASWLESKDGQSHYVVTPGPEFLVTASKDLEFKKILNHADLSVNDGVGLRLAGVQNITPGVDLMIALCELAAEKGWTVGLFGGEEGVAEKTSQVLHNKFKNIRINFAVDGKKADEIISHTYSTKGAKLACDLFFVNLGHPKQEKFIASHLNSKSELDFRVAMGVGGSFDLISGNITRAPKFLQVTSLEWLFRIFAEKPERKASRIRRILKATIIFPLLLVKEKIIKPVA